MPGEQARPAAPGAGHEDQRAARGGRGRSRGRSSAATQERRGALPGARRHGRSRDAPSGAAGVRGRCASAPSAPHPASPRHVLERTVVLPRAARAVPADPQGGLHERAVAAGRARRASRRSASTRSPLPEVSPALTVHDMNVVAPEHRLVALRRGRARADARRGRLAALHARARPGAAAVVGLAVQAAAARAALRRDVRRRAVVPARAASARGEIVDDFRALRRRASAAARREDVHWAVQHELVSPAPARPRRPRRADGGDAGAAARRTSARRAGRPDAAHENAHAAAAAAARLRRGDRGGPARALRARTSRPSATTPSRRAGDGDAGRVGARRSSRCCRLLRATIDDHARVGQLHRLAQRRGGRVRSAEKRLERRAPARRERRALAAC